MTKIGIYKITSPSGKVYIGQSWDIDQRFKYYKDYHCKNQPYLYNSLIRYGSDKHVFEIAHELPYDVEQSVMDQYEQLYMDTYRDAGIELLNIREGGSNGKLAEESKQKISAKRKEYYTNNPDIAKEAYERISEANKQWRQDNPGKAKEANEVGIKAAIEWRKNNPEAASESARQSVLKNPEGHKRAYEASVAARKGKLLTDDHKKKMSIAGKGRPKSEEHKRKIGEAQKGKPRTSGGTPKKPVKQLSLSGELIKEWPCAPDAAKYLLMSRQCIQDAARGKQLSAGGYLWRYT